MRVLDALNEIAPLLVVVFGMATVGSIIGILWFRAFSPSSFDKNAVLFIIKMFWGIGIGGVLLSMLMKSRP
jgi:hypothetical protein